MFGCVAGGMTSAARLEANRRNATRSTGPKTRKSKARAARNAFRHGFSLPIERDSALSRGAESLARAIAGEGASSARLEAARRIAEAQIDLVRVRTARFDLLRNVIDDPDYQPEKVCDVQRKLLAKLGFDLSGKIPEDLGDDVIIQLLPAELTEAERAATAMQELAGTLYRLDRYERRAFSRRKFAVRAFDQLPTASVGLRRK